MHSPAEKAGVPLTNSDGLQFQPIILKYATPSQTEGQLPNMVHTQCASVMRVGSVMPLLHGMPWLRHPRWDGLRIRRSSW